MEHFVILHSLDVHLGTPDDSYKIIRTNDILSYLRHFNNNNTEDTEIDNINASPELQENDQHPSNSITNNVEGVVLFDNDITTNISHSNGQSYSRRSLKIKDDTGTINITIWNEKIAEVPEQVVNKTIRMRNGKINHYHGKPAF
ncbi:unnamed protein product [Rotaria socialis]|uniref:Replication protein A OB domain-containing protein n=1 Tax=Rotaria socialis TaxID=392032 RepID=A0A818H9B3_9BILA|nr:unnamed protein product [Rotaria socialis]